MIRRGAPSCWNLRRQTEAATVVEFALVLPVFLLALLGMMDLGFQFYAQHILSGAVNQAARKSTLEIYADDPAGLDDVVAGKVKVLLRDSTLSFDRKAYREFSNVGKPEPFTDSNRNGIRDPRECFEDINDSGAWEADMGRSGNGGADDVVLYTVGASYQRLFPFWSAFGQTQEVRLQATSVLRNQPFANNRAAEPKVICT